MQIGCGNLDDDIADFALPKICEIIARVELKNAVDDRRRSFGGRYGDGVGERGAVVVAVGIVAKRVEGERDRVAAFDRSEET